MNDITSMVEAITEAIKDGRTVTIKADEFKIDSDETTASGLEITIG